MTDKGFLFSAESMAIKNVAWGRYTEANFYKQLPVVPDKTLPQMAASGIFFGTSQHPIFIETVLQVLKTHKQTVFCVCRVRYALCVFAGFY